MKLISPGKDWFFAIEETRALVTLANNVLARSERVPLKHALFAAVKGDIAGIVGAGYRVFTNQQAVALCHKFCFEAYSDTIQAEWAFGESHGPGIRSWAAMDIHNRPHAINPISNDCLSETTARASASPTPSPSKPSEPLRKNTRFY